MVAGAGPEELHPGWTLHQLPDNLIRITAPDGAAFYSRKKALEHMLETGVEPEHIPNNFSLQDLAQGGHIPAMLPALIASCIDHLVRDLNLSLRPPASTPSPEPAATGRTGRCWPRARG